MERRGASWKTVLAAAGVQRSTVWRDADRTLAVRDPATQTGESMNQRSGEQSADSEIGIPCSFSQSRETQKRAKARHEICEPAP
jgi:hypothetical protein